jgi:hypothetical protein
MSRKPDGAGYVAHCVAGNRARRRQIGGNSKNLWTTCAWAAGTCCGLSAGKTCERLRSRFLSMQDFFHRINRLAI